MSDSEVIPPLTWATGWLEGVLSGSREYPGWWCLTHPTWRSQIVEQFAGSHPFAADMEAATLVRDLGQAMLTPDDALAHPMWQLLWPVALSVLRADLPGEVRFGSQLTHKATLPESPDRQTYIWALGSCSKRWAWVGEPLGFGLTVERVAHGWAVVAVEAECTFPQWLADADN